MKYSQEIDINLPRKRVIELFDNTENLYKWQEGLQSFELIEGEPGKNGAKSIMVFQMGKRKIEMIETITNNSLPDQMEGTYNAKGVLNIISNQFIDNGNTTKWISKNEFQFSGFMKIMGIFMKNAFCKQSFKYMKDFKKFAENEK